MEVETTQKDQILKSVISQIEREFGKGSIMKLGQRERMIVESISTGSLSLDIALGVGGFPRGRISEIFGQESSGKTTLALTAIANAQSSGGIAAFIDAEHALDPEYARKIGVDVDNLYISQPDSGEQALSIVEMLAKSNAVDIIVIDSVAALVPQAEIEGQIGDQFIGLQARLMSQALRKLTSIVGKSRTAVIFINQIREKVGVMFGNPETTPGGRALKFYASVRIELRKIDNIKKGEVSIGSRIKAKVVKNKVSPPFKEAQFSIIFGKGIDRIGEIADLATEINIISKSGSWYSFGDEKIGQGREKVIEFLESNPEKCKEIEGKIIEILNARE
ncbi:MAG: recombinase RecA [Candidatus Calescibacterium sp.]|nr:recombinase RecA [Candidatus Calescibacterium sp.]MCX7972662.1 recombinase RecA [bacterium]MDW8194741.1 recombinase RecA [Candidatus Calescibacterium sp.]